MVRLDCQCLPILIDRFIQPASLGQEETEIVMGVGAVGLALHGFLKIGHCLIEPASHQQGGTKVVVDLAIVGIIFRAFRYSSIASSSWPQPARLIPMLL